LKARTPKEWFEQQQDKLEVLAAVDVRWYFQPDEGHEFENLATFLLVIRDGLNALGAYCLSQTGVMVLLESPDDPAATDG
jgi:hypothetical protein